MGTRRFSKYQYGKEATRGTAVAATRILVGAGIKGVPVDRKPEYQKDAIAVRAEAYRSYMFEYLLKNTLTIEEGYFQILPALFGCGLKGGVTASEQTPAQADYLWDFTPAMAAANSPDSLTLELGDDDQAYEAEYLMFQSLKISGDIPQEGGAAPVKLEAPYFARQVTKTTFTGSLSIPSVTPMNAKLAQVYKDAAWANRGTTELAAVLRSFEAEILFGIKPMFLGDGNRYFTTFQEDIIGAMLTLTVKSGAAAGAIYDEFQAGTAKAYQLKITGPVIGTGLAHSLKLSIWGQPEMVEPLASDAQGANMHQVLIHGLYETTGAQIVEPKVSTSVNAY